MRGRRVALGVAVMVVLLLGTLLAYTAVGRVVGPHWSDPAAVADVESDPDTFVADVAAAGSPEGGAVAWIERDGDRRIVRVARFTARNGTVAVGERRTVARRERRATGLDVAVTGQELVVTWERPIEDRVVLARVPGDGADGGGSDGGEDGGSDAIDRRVVADPFRVEGTGVTYTPAGPLVVYSATDSAPEPFEGRAALVHPEGDVTRHRVGGPTHPAHAPAVASAGERLAVVWWNGEDLATMVTTGRVAAGSGSGAGAGSAGGAEVAFDRTDVAGQARVRGSFGGSSREVPFVAGARNAGSVRPVWTDGGTLTTVPVADGGDGRVGDATTLGDGSQPGVAARGDRWLIAWVVPRGGTGDDVVFRHSDGTGGVLSQFTSTAVRPRPAFAPGLAVAWAEWAGTDRVLVSAYRPEEPAGVLARLANDPQRFAFLALAAAAIGLVTVPIMPWSFVGLFGAFVLTTGVVTSRVLAAGAYVGSRLGRETTPHALRRRAGGAPAALWVCLFAAVQIPLAVFFIATVPRLQAFGFAHPVGASAGALIAAVVLVAGGRIRSNWMAVIAFVCLQNAALWAIAVTVFL